MRSFCPKLSVAGLAALLAFSVAAKADTIGTLTPGGTPSPVDGDQSDAYIVNQAFSAAGASVTSFTIDSLKIGTITPFLATGISIGGSIDFTITGVGSTYTDSTVGAETFAFGLTSGSAVTGANTYFGFFNSVAPGSGSDVGYSYTTATGGTFLFVGDGSGAVGTGSMLDGTDTGFSMDDTGDTLNNRAYYVTATTGATPEPGSLALLGTGLAGLATIRRRFKK